MLRKVIKFTLVICCMLIIFMFSSDSGTASSKKSDSVIINLVEVISNKKVNNKDRDKYIEEITGQKLNPIMVQKRKDYLKKIYKEQKEILQKRIRKSEESRINEYQQKYLAEHNIHCPYCNSTNVTKIGTVNRMVSTSMLGLASKKIGKQWYCNSCNSDF